ncbi:TetR/AcrR family transcriptional regulator [Prauserella oleivorans]|uniref:TetR/AcrR family transcriptional regulator n=1 Tax=Prauserella oleivorans TaxID=1478153 RepID=A0ABW5W8A8_9PSEU
MTAGTVGTAVENTRTRLLATALRLFSEHGVEGTSLQMIAAELGVTKAAVYYHFKTKDEIADAVVAPALRELDQLVDEASTRRTRGARIDHALAGFVDLLVRHRTLAALLPSDPGILRAIDRSLRPSGREPFTTRLLALISGPDPDIRERVLTHVLLAGLGLAAGAPDMAELDDETLREHLIEAGRRLLGRPRRRQ